MACADMPLVQGLRSPVKETQSIAFEIPTLRDFLVGAWENVLHPAEPLELEGAWYVDLICEHLTVVSVTTLLSMGDRELCDRLLAPYGKTIEDIGNCLTKNLRINIPPRCTKSTIVTVCWPCWEWSFAPWFTYMCMSYDQPLASDHSDDRRTLIKSDWYQSLGQSLALSGTKNRITEFKNEHQGEMKARGLNSGVTGGGGLRLIFDDPNDPNKIDSEPLRLSANKSFKDYSTTRKNDPKRTAVVLTQQRTNQKDVSGWVEMESPEHWVSVVIPMEAEIEEAIKFPLSDRIIQRKPGDIMHPARFDSEIIANLKRDSRLWAGRYQQRPSEAGGGMFKIRNWRLYIPGMRSLGERTILSVDATFKGLKTSDFVVVGVAEQQYGIRTVKGLPEFDTRSGKSVSTEIKEHRYYFPYRWRNQAGITETERAIAEVAQRFPQAHTKLIEDKANGPAIIDRLSSVMHGLEAYKPGSDSKTARAAAVVPIHERGDLCLPLAEWAIATVEGMGLDSITVGEWWDLHPPPHELDAEHVPCPEWAKSLIDEAGLFPSGEYDDQVDYFVQAVNWLEHNDADAMGSLALRLSYMS